MPKSTPEVDALDKAKLKEALVVALKKWPTKKAFEARVFEMGEDHGTGAVGEALARTRLFKSLAGKVVYESGWAREVPDYMYLHQLMDRAKTSGPDRAIEWLYRVLGSRDVGARVVAALWGITVKQAVNLTPQVKLVHFSKAPSSETKQSVVRSSHELGDEACWIDYFSHELPSAALIIRTDRFPYIGEEGAAYDMRRVLEAQVGKYVSLLEGMATGSPIMAAYWFNYEQKELEIGYDEENFSWHHHEVLPTIKRPEVTATTDLARYITLFHALPEKIQSSLMRSMKRFSLSQRRHELIDQILDLVLAYEIAATISSGDNIPASWKVSVRPAVLIGGSLTERSRNRALLAQLYKLRNSGSHGGSLMSADHQVVDKTRKLFPSFMRAMVKQGRTLDWVAIDLGAGL